MTRFVIDARTLLHIVANDIRPNPKHQIVAPNLIRSQALSLLLEAVRAAELSEDLALQYQRRITGLKIRLLGDRVSLRTAWKIAREQDWETTYDAEYLAVTQLQADALVTIDPAMAKRGATVVPLAELAALVTE
ncbi:type II toxin-antitoxin system VapC family toxin [Glaciibacter sp. 2TAF33]|uniref:type II toxin-antitoxin system VapC family toxin n=1 Tax=Glaciibacter sp. 2TAF33 TaxID=3233015 RepID=UPI003F92E159